MRLCKVALTIVGIYIYYIIIQVKMGFYPFHAKDVVKYSYSETI